MRRSICIVYDQLVIWCRSNRERWRIQNYEAERPLKSCYHKYELLSNSMDHSASELDTHVGTTPPRMKWGSPIFRGGNTLFRVTSSSTKLISQSNPAISYNIYLIFFNLMF